MNKQAFEKIKQRATEQVAKLRLRWNEHVLGWWKAQSFVTKKVLVVLSLLLAFTTTAALKSSRSSRGEKEDSKKPEEPGHESKEGVVVLTPEQLTESGIETSKAVPGDIREYIDLPGEVVLNSDKATHVNPRYAGVVKAVYKYLGDSVKAGDSLAVIESNAGLQRYTLQSSIDGVVIKRDINVGEFVPETTEVFAIADLSTVWVNMTVYQKDLDRVKKGQEVIVTADNGMPPTSGVIFFAAPIVDEKTRTALAAVKLENSNLRWKPGQFVTGKAIVGQGPAPLLVAKAGVQTVEDKPSVFVKTEKGFETRHLKLGREDAENYEVLEGLKVGEEYISKNSFLVKAEIGKGEAEHED